MGYRKKKFASIMDINKYVKNIYCKTTERKLSDNFLIKKFRESPSSQKKIRCLHDQLKKLKLRKSDIVKIMNNEDILNEFCVPPGTKGVIRGNHFNSIVKDKITQIINKLKNKKDFEYGFEKKIEQTHEIPDWYIKQKSTDKTMIGMNQIDLWSGGQQTNRGSKYILNEEFHNNPKFKIVSVVSKFIQLESSNNKAFNILKRGFETNRLCYVGNLENVIKEYFKN